MTERYKMLWQRFCHYFVSSPEELNSRAQLCEQLWPNESELSLATADLLLENTFLFQLPWDMEQTVTPVCFGKRISWAFFPEDDEEFTFQMNRHRYWICLGQAYHATGDEQYAACFVRQLTDWIEKEPLREDAYHHTWRTIEAGLRADYWCRAMALFAHSPAVTGDVIERFFMGLEAHALRLSNNPRIGFSMKSNWGVLEYTGLYILGYVLDNETYLEQARSFVKDCLHIQVMDDGMQWEASPMYHNEVLMCMMELLRVSRLFGDSLFDAEELDLIRKMALVDMYLKNPEHRQPMVGDSDDTDLRDLITQAAWLFGDGILKFGGYPHLDYESIWLYGTKAAQQYAEMETVSVPGGLTALRNSEQVVYRTGWNMSDFWLYYVNGPLGGGHGHSDKLHVSLWMDGDEILTDPGRFTYTDTPLRYELKNAVSHNVPMVDRLEYAPASDSWSSTSLPVSMPNRVSRKGDYILIEGSHIGYAFAGVTVSRRVLVLGNDAVIICDDFFGNQNKTATQRFHFGEFLKIESEKNVLQGRGAHCRFRMTSFAEGRECVISLEEGPFSRHYNQLSVCPVADVTAENVTSLTSIFVREIGQPVRVETVPVENFSYGTKQTPAEAEGYRVYAGDKCYGVVFLHHDVGNTADLNGLDGVYGLGRTMVCDLNRKPRYMTVLQW